jgi:hypothetical protein
MIVMQPNDGSNNACVTKWSITLLYIPKQTMTIKMILFSNVFHHQEKLFRE